MYMHVYMNDIYIYIYIYLFIYLFIYTCIHVYIACMYTPSLNIDSAGTYIHPNLRPQP